MLVFRNATGCSSWVGMELFKISDPQFVNISRDCTMGNIMHEIGHAVGVFHEQSRGDRDDFVRVDFGQVAEGSREQFYQFLDFGNDIGPYDFGSIMHYDCDAFEKDGASGPTVEPIVPGFGCADIGQRDGFSDGDIFGTYRLYPPQYRIVGAEPDAVSDRFELSVEFSTKPVRDEYIVWRVFGIERGPRGATFSSVDTGILPGRYPFVAEIQIGGETLTTEVIWLTVAANEVPVVDLGPDRDAFVGETVAIVSSVADPEDGSCPVPLCTFTWDPAPTLDRGGVADFVFDTPGEHVVSLAVQDGTGATGSGQVRITVTQKPFVPIINTPTRGQTFNPGATTVAMGSATWGDDVLTCSQVGGVWSSSDPGDVLSTRNSCSADITFSATSGPRTITMNATSPAGGVPVLATVDVVVEACVGNCPPDVSFEILPDPILDGSAYQPPFTGPGYYLTTRLQIHGQMRDPDGASGELIQYELSVSPPCLGGCAPIPLASGSGIGPIEAFIPWVPANDIAIWTNCAQTALPYKITLSARDAGGAQRETSRTIHLACTLR